MIKYSTGIRKKIFGIHLRLDFALKRLRGVLTGYPVYRQMPDHPVYAEDNKLLGSTTRSRAKIVHQVSCVRPPDYSAVIEFEHPFALLGHLDEKTDYVHFRLELKERMSTFWRGIDPQRHRLIAASFGAAELAKRYYIESGVSGKTHLMSCLPWSIKPRRSSAPALTEKLHVFHYGGLYPAAKGTLDVFETAKLLPDVRFYISVDCSHWMLPKVIPGNIEMLPIQDKAAYLKALAASHVMLSPVFGDGWGVVLDAQAFALPIVIYDTYDKSEAVEDGVTGTLLHVSKSLSFFDGILTAPYKNWTEYNEYIASSGDRARVATIAAALSKYSNKDFLITQSKATQLRVISRHDPKKRVSAIAAIYRELQAKCL